MITGGLNAGENRQMTSVEIETGVSSNKLYAFGAGTCSAVGDWTFPANE